MNWNFFSLDVFPNADHSQFENVNFIKKINLVKKGSIDLFIEENNADKKVFCEKKEWRMKTHKKSVFTKPLSADTTWNHVLWTTVKVQKDFMRNDPLQPLQTMCYKIHVTHYNRIWKIKIILQISSKILGRNSAAIQIEKRGWELKRRHIEVAALEEHLDFQ